MFGRRKQPFASPPAPLSGPPPRGKEPFPIDKMDRALDATIRLFTRVLDDSGVDAGGLALRGHPIPDNVAAMLADCTTYRSDHTGELTYLALGITPDFKSFAYPPHCRLYFILNSVGLCEDVHASPVLRDLAPHQLPSPMVDAHFMRRWIRYILPTGDAMASKDARDQIANAMRDELLQVMNAVPDGFMNRANLESAAREWGSGFPGTIGRPLDASVERMNGLPITPFIGEVLTNELTRLQMDGLRRRA